MIDYPLEPGQRMLVKSNSFRVYAEHAHRFYLKKHYFSSTLFSKKGYTSL